MSAARELIESKRKPLSLPSRISSNGTSWSQFLFNNGVITDLSELASPIVHSIFISIPYYVAFLLKA